MGENSSFYFLLIYRRCTYIRTYKEVQFINGFALLAGGHVQLVRDVAAGDDTGEAG